MRPCAHGRSPTETAPSAGARPRAGLADTQSDAVALEVIPVPSDADDTAAQVASWMVPRHATTFPATVAEGAEDQREDARSASSRNRVSSTPQRAGCSTQTP